MKIWKALGIGAMLALASCGQKKSAGNGEEVNFSILATESSENLMPKWQPFLDDMTRMTGLRIKPFFADDYAGLIEAMRFNRVQVGWFSNKSGLEAVKRSQGEVFAQSTYSDGAPGYYSDIVVKKGGKIKSIDQLLKCDKTINFGMGDPNSFSGYLVPVVYLFAPRNFDPDKCFKTSVNQTHEANALSVYNDRLDAAANNSTNLKVLAREKPQAAAGLVEIWRSPLLGLDPIIYRKDLDPKVKAKLRKFFHDYGRVGTPEQVAHAREVLKGLEFGLFNAADGSILNQVREVDIKKQLYDMRAETGADAEARRRQLKAELEAFDAVAPAPAAAR